MQGDFNILVYVYISELQNLFHFLNSCQATFKSRYPVCLAEQLETQTAHLFASAGFRFKRPKFDVALKEDTLSSKIVVQPKNFL